MDTTSSPLHPRLAEILDFIGAARTEVFDYVEALPPDVLAPHARPDAWSVQENMEHLSMIEGGIGRLFTNMVKQANAEGAHAEQQTDSLLGCLDVFGADDMNRKIVAPENVRPGGTRTVAESMEMLRASRTRLVEAVHKANGLDLNRVSASHPLFGPMTAYQWLLLVGKHELRHLHQMKNNVAELQAAP